MSFLNFILYTFFLKFGELRDALHRGLVFAIYRLLVQAIQFATITKLQ